MQEAKPPGLTLERLDGRYAVARLPADSAEPGWARGPFVTVTRTREELSVVCESARVPATVLAARELDLVRVSGKLDFAVVGVIAGISTVLAEAAVSLFVVSTHDTDYLMWPRARRGDAARALSAAGYGWVDPD